MPLLVFVLKGYEHLCYSVWSIRSLKRHGFRNIIAYVSNEAEREFLLKPFPRLTVKIASANPKGYPKMAYKPFVLVDIADQLIELSKGFEIVVCDADILWKQNPAVLFERFKGKNWVHKITAWDMNKFIFPDDKIAESDIGIRTIRNYAKKREIVVYPNFNVNAGLFMLKPSVFKKVMQRWREMIGCLDGNEMLMSEALLALTYAELGLRPCSDREDIKHLGTEKIISISGKESLTFEILDRTPHQFSGYQTAKHYFGPQRPEIRKDAVEMGLDVDNLAPRVRARVVANKVVKRLKRLPFMS